MITPAGMECGYYYEDFARGASRQECRAAKAPRSATWRPGDCGSCPVPSILAANGSDSLELRILISKKKVRLGPRVSVEAWCALHGPIGGDPHVGCAECNAEADDLLRRALE